MGNKRTRKGAPISERLEFHSMPVTECGCLVWTGPVNAKGYGIIAVGVGEDKKVRLAHRMSWENSRGPIPDGMLICHKCDVPSCINVDHLFVGTVKDNSDDMISKNRQVVLKGDTHGMAKITWALAALIRSSQGRHKDLAVRFNVHKSTVDHIKAGHTWVNPPNQVMAAVNHDANPGIGT